MFSHCHVWFPEGTDVEGTDVDHRWHLSMSLWRAQGSWWPQANLRPAFKGHVRYYPLVITNVAIENGHRKWILPWKMVIFHSYVTVYQRVHYMTIVRINDSPPLVAGYLFRASQCIGSTCHWNKTWHVVRKLWALAPHLSREYGYNMIQP